MQLCSYSGKFFSQLLSFALHQSIHTRSNLFVDRFELLGGEIVGAGAGGDASGVLTIDSMTIGGETAKYGGLRVCGLVLRKSGY